MPRAQVLGFSSAARAADLIASSSGVPSFMAKNSGLNMIFPSCGLAVEKAGRIVVLLSYSELMSGPPLKFNPR